MSKLIIELPQITCVNCGYTYTPRKVYVRFCPECGLNPLHKGRGLGWSKGLRGSIRK